MKAIVLTYDRNHPLADHMIQTYERLWPFNSFVFRIPFQADPAYLLGKYKNKVEMVESPPDIKNTVLTLLQDLPDSEWVYWCIDDKFLLDVNIKKVAACHDWVLGISEDNIQGVMFCRCRRLLEEENLKMDQQCVAPDGQRYVARKNYYQFWIHQYLRVVVLRELFESFPDEPFVAKQMDVFTGQEKGLKVMQFKEGREMYVSLDNYASFGESSRGGRITAQCYESMREHDIAVPSDYQILHKSADCVRGVL